MGTWIVSFTLSQFLIVSAALFAAYNFGLAGGYLEGRDFSFGGLLLGITVNLVVAAAASKFGSVTGKNRRKQATTGIVLLMSISPILLSSVFFEMLGDDFYEPLFRWVWSIAWASAPDLAIFLAGASNGTKGIISLDTKITIPALRRPESKPTSNKKVVAVKVKTSSNKSRKKPVKKKATAKKGATSKQLLDEWRKDGFVLDSALAKKFNVKRQAIWARKDSMKKKGLIKIVDGAVVVQ